MTNPELKWVELVAIQILNIEADVKNMQAEIMAKEDLRQAYIKQLQDFKAP